MEWGQRGTAARSDDGMTLIETVMAISLLAIALTLTIGPTLSSFGVLRDAKVIDVGQSMAQGRLEEIRQFAFDDIGVVGGSPNGIIPATEVRVVQGIAYNVATDVQWVGSNDTDSGFDIGGIGADGVSGQQDFGRNYKWIQVSVQPIDLSIDPMVFSTAITPDYVSSGSDGVGTVVVRLRKHEPVGSSSSASDWPSLYLVPVAGGAVTPTSGIATGEQTFSNLTPNLGGGPYRIRLGSTLSDVGGGGWRIHPSDLVSFTDQVAATAGQAVTVSLTIYKDVDLRVEVSGAPVLGGIAAPLERASLILGYEGRYVVLDDDDQAATGVWNISEFEGNPLIPGQYTLQLDAPGYVPYGALTLDVTEDYPTVTQRVEIIELDVAANNTAEMTFIVTGPDGQPIRGALVNINSDGYGPLVQTTDANGSVRFNLPVGSKSAPTIVVQSPYGHEEQTVGLGPIVAWGTETISLATPSQHGLVVFVQGDYGYFQFLPFGSGANWSAPVLPNINGTVSAALPANGLGNDWLVRKVCWNTNEVVAETAINVAPNGTTTTWGAGIPACLP